MSRFEHGVNFAIMHVAYLPQFDLRAYHNTHHRDHNKQPLPWSTCEFCLGVRSVTEA